MKNWFGSSRERAWQQEGGSWQDLGSLEALPSQCQARGLSREARAHMYMVSDALASLGFRVWGYRSPAGAYFGHDGWGSGIQGLRFPKPYTLCIP